MPGIPAARVLVDDVDLAYRELGSGPPLIFISGFGSTMDMWNPPVLAKISGHSRVIVFDNRGAGLSGSSNKPFSIPRFALDTAALMDALGIPSAVILGHSMGASIAQELALRFPEKVSRLILVAAECRGSGTEGVRSGVLARMMDRSGTVQDAAGRMFSLLFPPSWLSTHDPWRYCPEVYETVSDESLARQASAFSAWPGVFEQLGNIRAPTLVITGTDDIVVPPENSRIISRWIPRARLAEFPGAGHGLMYQVPEEFSACVTGFLDT